MSRSIRHALFALAVFAVGCVEETIAPDAANQPPVVSAPIPDQRLPGPGETTTIEAAGHFSDPDGGALTYSVSSSDTSAVRVSIEGSVVTLTGGGGGGAARVTVTARDPGGLEAQAGFGVLVNRYPVVSGEIPPQKVVVETTPLEVDASEYFYDPDGDPLVLAAVVTDTAVADVRVTGTVVVLTTRGIGDTEVRVTARDPDGLEAMAVFSLAVVENPDREALTAFYEAMNEPTWWTNWLTDAPLGEWYGVTVNENGWVTRLDFFDPLSYGNSAGGYVPGGQCGSCRLPPELGNLTALEHLELTNYGLTGPIPPELGNLVNLRHLALGDLLSGANNLTGEIPAELGNLTELRILFLDNNDLTGPIPPELGKLEHLEWLLLGGNDLAGGIPPEFGDLTALEHLSLHGNELTGTIPTGLVSASPWILFHGNAGLCAPGTARFVPWMERMKTPRIYWIPGYDLDPFGDSGGGPYCNKGDAGALNRIFESSGGHDWTNSTGWGATPALEEWYGVHTDSLGRVTTLDLTRNGLAGPLPNGLDSLTALTRLLIGGNALTGRLPLALAHLGLQELDYAETGLCAPPGRSFQAWLAGIQLHRGTGKTCAPLSDRDILVAVYEATGGPKWKHTDNWLTDEPLGSWYGVRVNDTGRVIGLDLSGNRMRGAIPRELGELSELETLDLSPNPSLGGRLPKELAALGRLRRLRARDTDLCAPLDPGFQAWVRTIGDRWIEPCQVQAYLIQAVQSHHTSPVPLVAGRGALLRAFVTRTGTQARIPPVRARFYHDGREVHVEDIPGRPELIPFSPDESDLAKSSNAEVPGSVIQPGLEMVIEVDPHGTLDPSVAVVKRIPEAGRLPIEVKALPTLQLTLVPLVYSDTKSAYAQSVANLVKALVQDPESNLRRVHTLLPVGRMDVKGHEVVAVTEATGRNIHDSFSFFSAVQVVRRLEGGRGHWMGLTGEGYGGLAELGGWVSWSELGSAAHELGHNMGLGHAPNPAYEPSRVYLCDHADNADPNYPYLYGSIGGISPAHDVTEGSAWGWDSSRRQLVPPYFPDVMSYCRNVWVSDYHFTKAMDRRRYESVGSAVVMAHSAPARSLLLWGGIDSTGVPYIEPAFVVDAPLGLPEARGPWTLEGRGADGLLLFSLSFAMPEVADAGNQAGSFAYTLPVRPGWENLATITFSGPSGTAILDQSTDRPVSIWRDQSGQVRAILRGDQVQADGAAVGLPGVALDVLTSRGVPPPLAWRR